jgi:hypothetical protein
LQRLVISNNDLVMILIKVDLLVSAYKHMLRPGDDASLLEGIYKHFSMLTPCGGIT